MEFNTPQYPKRLVIEGTITAFVVSTIILILAVLPAEYGIDPTGIGGITGLTKLAQAKKSLTLPGAFVATSTFQTTTQKITLAAREGVEFKFAMLEGSVLLYDWSASAPVYFDFHGEPTTPAGQRFLPFKSHKTGTAASSTGYLIPEFTGRHGWYWRNLGPDPVTITLRSAGYYDVIGLINRSGAKK